MVQDRKPVKQHDNRGQSKSWTFLLVGEFGKIASFRVSKVLLLSLVVTLIVFLGYTILLTVQYDRLRGENDALRGSLHKTEDDLVSANKAKDKALVRLMLLAKDGKPGSKPAKEKKKKPQIAKKPKLVISKKTETPAARKVDTSDTSSGKTGPAKEKKGEPQIAKKPKLVISKKTETPAARKVDTSDTSSGKTGPAKESTGTESSETNRLAESAVSNTVLVQEFEIQTVNHGTSLRFKFKLENIDPQTKKITGYTFVVLEPAKGSKEPTRISPWSPLKDGRPTKIRRGQYFGIARFKYVRGTLPDIMDVSRFKNATVYVYSPAGDLLAKKVYDVAMVLRS
ncbi:MAG: hypothetical protein JRF24_01000 [Deltaproteobacteria bacterium]|nr:hypothetical protein [Deltaproteobacteria bacterium]